MNNILNSKKWYLLPIIGLIIMCIPIFFWQDFYEWRDNKKNRLIEEYPSIKDINKELKSKVVHKQISPFFSGTYLFHLSNGDKFSLANQERNYQYEKLHSNLMRMLSVGDSIYKPKNTDSIYVFRNKSRYYFIAEE